MSSLMILLAFILPVLAAPSPYVDAADVHTLFPSNPAHDVLNVTQCYCKNPNSLSPDAMFGYYVRVLSLLSVLQ